MEENKLSQYYQDEIDAFEQQCQAFAKRYPLAASNLAVAPDEINSPITSHLLQAIALNNAQLKYQFEQLQKQASQTLATQLFPQFQNPMPAEAIVQLTPDDDMEIGQTIPQGTALESFSKEKERYHFQTLQTSRIYPFHCISASWQNPCLSLDLALTGKATCFSEIQLDKLHCYFQGQFSHQLYALIFSDCVKLSLSDGKQEFPLDLKNLYPIGFDTNSSRQYQAQQQIIAAYQYLTEYAHFPEQFLGFTLDGLDSLAQRCKGKHLYINFYLNTEDANNVTPHIRHDFFAFNTAPIINLFTKTLCPINIDNRTTEYKLIADTQSDSHFDLNQVVEVEYINEQGEHKAIQPLYHDNHTCAHQYHIRQAMALDGSNTLWLSLTQAEQLHGRTLLVHALCSNSAAVSKLTQDMSQPSKLQSIEPLTAIANIRWLTPLCQYKPALVNQIDTSAFLSLLTSHQHSLFDKNGKGLKQQLALFFKIVNPAMHVLIDAIEKIETNITYIRQKDTPLGSTLPCLHVHLTIDDQQIDAHLFAAISRVIDEFIRARSHVNTLVQTHVHVTTRQMELCQWPIRCGMQQIA